MPVRKIGNSHRSMTGVVTSVRDGVQHRYESGLERDLLLRLDFDRWRVERFEAQPVRIEYEGEGGKSRRYTPDVLAWHTGTCPSPAATLYEVKYEGELQKKRGILAPKFAAARRFASGKGWRFEVWTEKDIRTPFLENARLLRRLSGRPADTGAPIAARLLSLAGSLQEPTPDRLVRKALAEEKSSSEEESSLEGKSPLEDVSPSEWERAEALRHLWHLVARGHIEADFHSAPLTSESQLGKSPIGGPPQRSAAA